MIESTGQPARTTVPACFTGDYPIPLPDESRLGKHLLESRRSRADTLPVLNNP